MTDIKSIVSKVSLVILSVFLTQTLRANDESLIHDLAKEVMLGNGLPAKNAIYKLARDSSVFSIQDQQYVARFLSAQLYHRTQFKRRAAAQALGEMGKSAFGVRGDLFEVMKGLNEDTAAFAVNSLWKIMGADDELLDQLIQFLENYSLKADSTKRSSFAVYDALDILRRFDKRNREVIAICQRYSTSADFLIANLAKEILSKR